MNEKPKKQENGVLRELIMGILIVGFLFQIVFIWFTSHKWHFTSGLWIGVGIAIFMAIHMNYSIKKSLDRGEQSAAGYMQRMVVVRILTVVLLFAVAYLLRLGNVAAVFVGMITLKFGAYLQPLLHRLIKKRR